MADKFFILQALWSQSAGRNLLPGEHAELADLTPEQITKLTAGNVITPLVATPSASAGATTSNPPASANAPTVADPAAKPTKKG